MKDLKVKLALSLHTAIEHKRNMVMPFQKIPTFGSDGIVAVLVSKDKIHNHL